MKTSIFFFCALALVAGTSGNALAQQDSAISYYSSSLPQIDLFAGDNFNSIVKIINDTGFHLAAIAYGESFHLTDASGGYVDSITIGIDSTSADTIFVALFQAGTLNTYPFYTPNLNNEYFGTFILGSKLSGPSRITIPMQHTQVQQNFAVVVNPDSNKVGAINWIALRADNEPTEIRTATNTHSNFVWNVTYTNGEPVVEVVDSVLIPAGFNSPVYSNLDITAYISSSTSGVGELQPSEMVSLYPNPASNMLNIPASFNALSVDLLDLLGRRVLSSTVDGTGRIDVSQLRQGSYEAVIHSANGIVTTPIIIQR